MEHVKHPQRRLAPIVVAVEDPLLLPEALHIAAACGRPVIEAADPPQLARVCARACAVLADASFAPLSPSPTTFVVAASAETARPGEYVLPAQAADLLRALGAINSRGDAAVADNGRVVAVVGAAGGLGASTFAASISRRAAARGATLVDGHRRSGGLDLLLGIEDVPGARWGEVELGDGVIAREDIRRALPATRDDIAVLTCGRSAIPDPHAARTDDVDAVVSAVATAGVTVLDAPLEAVPARCDLAVVLVAARLRVAAAAARVVAECAAAGIPHALVVRDDAWASLSPAELEAVAGSQVLTRLRQVRGLTSQVERSGLPERLPRPLAQAADAVLAELTGAAR
ncbi:hypothetical protein M5J20_10005 [Corynebacterium sp. TA-R-1]|uniref:Septum formation initiator n=1 Tax=Corynebacterium stercoris TaxID=2943490 RepID=A0ABT1G3A7_9CORY|nr:septum site-determining protein Ssd [Corynebacterium stercoris]MCP1388508.1 hypothetical protein [Corynebacterium stercoris]